MSEFPTRLRSDFEALHERGGLALIDAPIDPLSLERACNKLSFHMTWEVYHEWAADEATAKSYWPFIAFAANHYAFERGEKATYVDEPTPSELKGLVEGIAADAKRLCDALARLQTLANRLDEIEKPDRRWHIGYIFELICQNNYLGSLAQHGKPAEMLTTPMDSALVTLAAGKAMTRLYQQLLGIEFGALQAKHAVEQVPRRPRPQADRGLAGLVALASVIWEHMTQRKASASLVFDTRRAMDVVPDFVVFVHGIAHLGGGDPTLAEIDTALKNCRS